jgi:hypothetical protein
LARKLAQFFVDERHQAGGCVGIACTPIDQHLGDVLSGRRRCHARYFGIAARAEFAWRIR